VAVGAAFAEPPLTRAFDFRPCCLISAFENAGATPRPHPRDHHD
jgi:hypothetical protein